MTDGAMAFGSVHFLTISQLLILASSLLSAHAEGQNATCDIQVLLKRNSKVEALPAETVKINCTVNYCDEKPAIRWCKLTELNDCDPLNETDVMKMQWRDTGETSGILFLHFEHIATGDSGLYRCQCEGEGAVSGVCMSHSIKVTVKEEMLDIEQIVDNENQTANASHHETADRSEWFWPAIYISSGIASVFFITTVSCLGLRRSGSRQARTEKAAENQYASVQMSDMAPPLPDSDHPLQNQPRPGSHAISASAQGHGECLYENGAGTRSRPTSNISSGDAGASHRHSANRLVVQNRTEEEEASPLVYASLNHQATTRSHTRPTQVNEEPTEYAAIRLS